MQLRHVLYFMLQNVTVSLVVYLLQVMLSFRFENQIIPLAAGLFGSFIGLFSWFFPDTSLFRWIFVWGHYSLLHFIGNTGMKPPESRLFMMWNRTGRLCA